MADQTNKDTDNKDQQQQVPRTFWQTINPGYIMAGLASLATAWQTSESFFFKARHDRKLDTDLEEIRDAGLKNADKNAAKAAKAAKNEAPNYWDYLKETNKVKKTFKTDQEARVYKTMGIEPGVKGSVKRFLTLAEHEKLKVAFVIATVTSIAVGAVYSFQRERRLTEKLHTQALNHVEQQSQQPGR